MLKKANIYGIKMMVASVDDGVRRSARDASRDGAIGVWKTRRRKTRDEVSMRQR
jgi:hypothetical protein